MWQKKLQARLGVAADGILGPNTYRALFAKLGARDEWADELGLAANIELAAVGISASAERFAMFLAQCAHESLIFDTWRKWHQARPMKGARIWATRKQAMGQGSKGVASFS